MSQIILTWSLNINWSPWLCIYVIQWGCFSLYLCACIKYVCLIQQYLLTSYVQKIYVLNFYTGLISTVVPPSSQRQQNLILVSQPSSTGNNISDTQVAVNSSLVTTLSVVECLTTSSSIVTSISGQHVSTITTTAGTLYYHRYKILEEENFGKFGELQEVHQIFLSKISVPPDTVLFSIIAN